MKVKIIEDDPKSLVIEFEGADRALAEFLKSKLLQNKDVDFTAVLKEHPEVGWPRLVVKSSKNAKGIVLKIVGQVEDDIKEFASQIPKK